MNREGPNLPIDTKINFIGVRSENLGRGLQQPSWLDVLQKIAWLDEGCTSLWRHNVGTPSKIGKMVILCVK